MLSIAVVGLALAFQSPAPEPPSRFPEHFLAGEYALEAGDIAGAKALFERCLALLPGNANATYELACAQARAGERDASLATLESAVAAGFDDASLARWDPDLESVRGEARFAAALARIKEASKSKSGRDLVRCWDNWFPCFSADGSTLAFGRGGNGFLLDVASNSLVSVFPKALRGIAWTSYSPDGRFVVSPIDENRILVWSGRTGELLHELGAPGSWQARVHWCESKPWFIASGVTPLAGSWIWNAETGEQIASFPFADAGSWISPDGTRAAILGSDAISIVRILDVESKQTIAEHRDLGRPMMDGGFSPDGKLLWILAPERGVLYLFDAATGAEVGRIAPEGAKLMHAVFCGPKSELIAADAEGRLHWIEVPGGRVIRTIADAGSGYSSFTASPDGALILCSTWGDAIRMRDAATGSVLWSLPAKDSDYWIFSSTFTPDSKHVLLPLVDRFHVYEASTGALERTLGDPWERPTEPAFDPSGRRMAIGCPDGSVRVVDVADARPVHSWKASDAPIKQCLWLAGGSRILTLDRERAVKLWDASEGKLVAEVGLSATLMRYPKFAPAVASPDGNRVLLYGPALEGVVIDPRDGARVVSLEVAEGDAGRVIWSRDGRRIAMTTAGGSIRVWDADTGKRTVFEATLVEQILALDISPDGKLLAAGSDDAGIKVWRLADSQVVCESHHKGIFDDELDIRSLCFSPDSGSVLYSTGDQGSVALLEVASGGERWRWEGNGGNGGTIRVAFDESGKRAIFAGMLNGLAHVVDAATGTDLAYLQSLGMRSLNATPGGRFLVGQSSDGLVVLDGARLKHLYTYTPFENQGWLAATPTLFCDGSPDATRAAWLAKGTSSWPLDSFGSVLVDRKRVRAAAAGVELAWPKLGTPPTLTVEQPAGRIVPVEGGDATLELTVVDANGLAGVELDTGVAGSTVLFLPIAAGSDGKPQTEARLLLSAEIAGPQTNALVRVVGMSGLLSRIARVTFVRRDETKR